MKSAKEWVDEHSQSGAFDLVMDTEHAERIVTEIQRDALMYMATALVDEAEEKLRSEKRRLENIEFAHRKIRLICPQCQQPLEDKSYCCGMTASYIRLTFDPKQAAKESPATPLP